MISGESFTLVTLNVDGMPKQILFFDVNTEGPGEENSPAIARYLINKQFDIILTQENFNYNVALTAPFDSAGYRHDIWGGGIDVELALDRLNKGEEMEGIFHIDGLTAFNQVRARAGLAGLSADKTASVDAFLDALLLERGHELLFEGCRKIDLIRFGKYYQTMSARGRTPDSEYFPIPNFSVEQAKNSGYTFTQYYTRPDYDGPQKN